MTLFDICRVIDSANRKLSSILDEQVSFEFDTWTNQSKLNMANSVLMVIKGELRSPKECHDKWMEDRASEGWSYGREKDVAKKTSPCMVSYEELPEEQKVKDSMFFHTAAALGNLLS